MATIATPPVTGQVTVETVNVGDWRVDVRVGHSGSLYLSEAEARQLLERLTAVLGGQARGTAVIGSHDAARAAGKQGDHLTAAVHLLTPQQAVAVLGTVAEDDPVRLSEAILTAVEGGDQ